MPLPPEQTFSVPLPPEAGAQKADYLLFDSTLQGVVSAIQCRNGQLREAAGTTLDILRAENNMKDAEIERLNRENRLDGKTGLLTMAAFQDEVRPKIESKRQRHDDAPDTDAYVFMLDLDDFKLINTLLGYAQTDDLVLTPFTDALRTTARRSDIIARFGGEEVVAYAENVPTREQALSMAAKYRQAANAISLSNEQGFLGVSIGMAKVAPGMSYDAAMAAVSIALNAAKKVPGKNSNILYEDLVAEERRLKTPRNS